MDGPYKACKIQEWIFYEYILNAVRQQGSEISILSGNAESVQCSKLLGSSKMPCHNIRSQFGHHVIASRERSVLPEGGPVCTLRNKVKVTNQPLKSDLLFI
ncbi:hypothetical protein CDAR_439801 [Caerostris darwini]|uniref:Uncharacterized protein n=1 Tax=Caerostris darwini TaxID=1538125 RepID=A0AAV4TR22_9ARAC|nr:hypothetical protein CDAR_439801 [Caerostris darwini]